MSSPCFRHKLVHIPIDTHHCWSRRRKAVLLKTLPQCLSYSPFASFFHVDITSDLLVDPEPTISLLRAPISGHGGDSF